MLTDSQREREGKNYTRLDKLEIRRGGTFIRKSLQLSVHLCIYGIVKVEYYSCNKGDYSTAVGHVITLRLPKCVKTREPKDEHCVLWCTKNK